MKSNKKTPVDISALVREHFAKVSGMPVNDKCSNFMADADAAGLTAKKKTLFAQLMLRNFCSYEPDLDLAKFYLSQMCRIGRVPADFRCEHPMLHELAHQCESPGRKDHDDTESQLLLILMEHPCYKPYLHSREYTDKYGCTFLDRYLIGKYHYLAEEDTPLRAELKKLFPEEYPKLAAKAVEAGKSLDPVVTYTGRGGRGGFFW